MNDAGKLVVSAHGEREIVMTRMFAAPRALVFQAYTTPELVRRWLLGPEGWTMPVCEIDLRVGGRYRYLWRHADGREMGMGGVYREVTAPERLVSTEVFDQPWYEGEGLGTLVFKEHEGKTMLTTTLLYQSRSTRDGVLKSPMESGVKASYDRLAAIVEAA